MFQLFARTYRWISALSLDVVGGAVVCALFFIKVLHVQISWALLPLALTVWIIYTADHLIDARKIAHEASSLRHRFHQQHFDRLRTLLFAAIIADVLSLALVSRAVILAGAALACFVALFALVQRMMPWMREIGVAVFYTCGVLIPAIAQPGIQYVMAHSLLIVQFSLVALTNLLILSWIDRVSDHRDQLSSFVLSAGLALSRAMIWTTFMLGMLLVIAQVYFRVLEWPGVTVGAMQIVLMLVFVSRERSDKVAQRRMIGDGVFLIPLIYLLW